MNTYLSQLKNRARTRFRLPSATTIWLVAFAWATIGHTSPQDDSHPQLPRGAKAKLGCSSFRSDGESGALAFIGDGHQLATAGTESVIRLWDIPSGAELGILRGHEDWVTSLCVTADRKNLISGSWDGTIRVWDVEHRKEVNRIKIPCDWITSLDFASGTNAVVAGCSDGNVRLITLSDQSVSILGAHDQRVQAVSCSADGKKAISASTDGYLAIWDVATRKRDRLIEASVKALSFSPTGELFASGAKDSSIVLWNPNTGELITTLSGHRSEVKALSFNSKGTMLVSGSSDRTTRIWDLGTRKCRKSIDSSGEVRNVTISPDATLIAASTAGSRAQIWNIEDSKELSKGSGHGNVVTSIAFSTKGDLVTSSSADGTILEWDASTVKECRKYEIPGSRINAVVYAVDGLVSGGSDSVVTLWNLSGEVTARLTGHKGAIFCLARNQVGNLLASGGADGTVRIWDLEKRVAIRSISAHESWVYTLAFSPDGTMIASGSRDGKLRVWSTEKGDNLAETNTGIKAIFCLAYVEEGKTIAFSGQDPRVHIWDWREKTRVGCLEGHTGSVRSMARIGNDILATGSEDKTLRIWNVTTLKSECVTTTPYRINAVAYSGKTGHLATGHMNGTSYIWLEKELRERR